jgi:hypothetical protein
VYLLSLWCILFSLTAKSTIATVLLDNLKEETELIVGGQIVVLQQRIPADDFTSGRVFLGKSSAAMQPEPVVGMFCIQNSHLVSFLTRRVEGYIRGETVRTLGAEFQSEKTHDAAVRSVGTACRRVVPATPLARAGASCRLGSAHVSVSLTCVFSLSIFFWSE